MSRCVQSVHHQFHSCTHKLLLLLYCSESLFTQRLHSHLSACDTFPTVTVSAKCSLLTNISKITSLSARLIATTVTSLFFSWYTVLVVLMKMLQSVSRGVKLIYSLQNVGLPRLKWHNVLKCCDNFT